MESWELGYVSDKQQLISSLNFFGLEFGPTLSTRSHLLSAIRRLEIKLRYKFGWHGGALRGCSYLHSYSICDKSLILRTYPLDAGFIRWIGVFSGTSYPPLFNRALVFHMGFHKLYSPLTEALKVFIRLCCRCSLLAGTGNSWILKLKYDWAYLEKCWWVDLASINGIIMYNKGG